MHHKLSRRKFIEQASCAAIGSTTFLSSILNLSTFNALAAQPALVNNDYKALVCILLAGGCDSFNILVPRGTNEYDEYAATRAGMALPQADLLPINPLNPMGKEFGLHPKFGAIQNLFEQGKAAFVSSIGTLVHPIADETDYKNNPYKRPQGLFSHSDQIHQWQTSVPQNRTIASGWGGRMADIMQSMNEHQNISMNISLSGKNVFQAGNSVIEYAIKNTGVTGLTAIGGGSNNGFLNRTRTDAVNSLLAQNYSNILQSTYAGLKQNALMAQSDFIHAIDKVPPFATTFSGGRLAPNLEMIAKVIAARDLLKMNRQTFFVNYGGWDHHHNLLESQDIMLEELSTAIGELYNALVELGLEDKVTIFTISDFGRTMTSNGTGTDHAWGGNALVVGGAVKGKDIYGPYPDLYLADNPMITGGRASIIPQISTDEYFAELALWYGLPSGNLSDVLPNIGNFYSHSPGSMPVGFMNV